MPKHLKSALSVGLIGFFLLTLLTETSVAGRFRQTRRGQWRRIFQGAPAPKRLQRPTDNPASHPLKPWNVAATAMFEEHGPVTVVDTTIVLQSGNPATGITHKPPVPRIDYEIHLEAKRIAGNDFFCGLTFPIGDASCSLILGGWGGSTVGLSNIDAQSANENESTTFIDFKNGQWYRIRLQVTTSRIDVWIDADPVIGIETGNHTFDIWWEQEPMRPLGIATWNTSAAIRNFEMKPLPVHPKTPATKE